MTEVSFLFCLGTHVLMTLRLLYDLIVHIYGLYITGVFYNT